MRKKTPAKNNGRRRGRSFAGDDLNYEIIVWWSKADEAFIAQVPELAGCMADGPTYQKAVTNAQVVMREWIETANELGRPIPKPRGRLMYA